MAVGLRGQALISFRSFDASTDRPAVLEASREQFGAGSYQSGWAYFDWLYRTNPAGRGHQDCIVAVQDGRPVGVIHRMILPASQFGRNTTVVSLQNHFMAPQARSGAGLLLLNRATKGDAVAFSPGVQGRLAEAYRRLGYREIDGFWLTRPLGLLGIALGLASSRLFSQQSFTADLRRTRRRCPDVEISEAPEEKALAALTALMLSRRRGGETDDALRVDWTLKLVDWRYFAKDGPRHLLVTSERSGAMAVLAFGLRKNVRVARVMELFPQDDLDFVDRVLAVARSAGAALALAFTMNAEDAAVLTAAKFRLRDNDTASFTTTEHPVAFGPAETDVGFESFRTQFRS